MADVYNDGDLYYGSQVITLAGTSYVAEEIEFEETNKTLDRSDELGNPNGAVYIRQKTTGKMTLQLLSSGTAIPEINATLAVDFRGVSKDFIVTKVGQPQKNDEIRKLQLEIAEILNP